MDRTPLIAGNWKMYKNAAEAVVLVQDLAAELDPDIFDEVEVAVIPPFTSIKSVSTVVEFDALQIRIGAQDCHWEAEGAFTGAIAPRMLKDLLVSYVIVGHSERRQMFGDTDETVNKKAKAVIAAGMQPIVCVGESLATYEAEETEPFVRGQVRAAFEGMSDEQACEVVVAYEPIWAIGTGHTPLPEQANDVARSIRATVGAMFGPPVAVGLRILYGGSVKPENAHMFLMEPDIDGALVGGASLDTGSFKGIVHAAR